MFEQTLIFDAEYLILPKYDMVIFDEAHNIESVAKLFSRNFKIFFYKTLK